MDRKVFKGRIVETEAYIGEDDKACHARFGKTERTKIMYGVAGHAYIYLCYGIHYLLNIVTERNDFPAAVLIRRIEPIERRGDYKNYGPGNLTKYLNIDKSLNGEDITASKTLWIEDDGFGIDNRNLRKGERVGVGYAREYAKKLWRFWIE
jgi:DNA-3-methyladenine glycosylase